MIEIKVDLKVGNPKPKKIDDFTITRKDLKIKISHAFGNCNVTWDYSYFHVSKTYMKCFEFVIGQEKIVRVDLDGLRKILEHQSNLRNRRKTEENVSKVTDLMLQGFIESKLEGLEFKKSVYNNVALQYTFSNIWTLSFVWSSAKAKNKQDVEQLKCVFNSCNMSFSKFCELIPQLKTVCEERVKLNKYVSHVDNLEETFQSLIEKYHKK